MIILSVLLILVLVCIDNSSELVKLISELKQRGFQLSEKLIVGSYKIYDLGLGDTIVIYCENRGVIWVMRFHEGVLVNQEIREYADNSETRQLG